MESKTLFRLSGQASVLAGICIILARLFETILFPGQSLAQQAIAPGYWVLGFFGFTGSLLVFAGIFGLFLWIAPTTGRLGFAAFLVAFTGIGISLGMNWAYAFALPDLALMNPAYVNADFPGSLGTGVLLAVGLGLLGWICLGVAAYAASNFPRWPSIILIISSIVLILPTLDIRASAWQAILANAMIAAGPLAYGAALWHLNRATGL